jgi:hypothetical protein
MDLIKLSLPAAFIGSRASISWREVRYGMEHQLLDPQAPVDLAVERLAVCDQPPAALVELAGRGKDEQTHDLVEQLADGEPVLAVDEIRDTWLYLVLSWIY